MSKTYFNGKVYADQTFVSYNITSMTLGQPYALLGAVVSSQILSVSKRPRFSLVSLLLPAQHQGVHCQWCYDKLAG